MAWGIAVAATSTLITMSGSLTYGAATGICGLAISGILISTSQIPGIAAMPILCLIGLSASFAELPVSTAGLLTVVWMGVLTADRVPKHRSATVIRFATAAVLAVATSLTYARFTNKFSSSDASSSGYDSSLFETPHNSSHVERRISHLKDDGMTKSTADGISDSASPNDDAVDPFAGLPME